MNDHCDASHFFPVRDLFLPGRTALVAAAWLLIALLLPTGTAQAITTRCVATSQQLGAALQEAASHADPVFLIRLREGHYSSSAQAFNLTMNGSNRLVEISGGWSGDNGSCAHKRFNPALTVISGTAQRRAFEFSLHALLGQSDNTVYLIDVTVENPSFALETSAACISGGVDGPRHRAILERIHARDCLAPFAHSGAISLSARSGAQVTARNIYIRSSMALNNGGLNVSVHDDSTAHLVQISVTGTQSSGTSFRGSGIALFSNGNGTIHLGNSVTWGNDPDSGTADLFVRGDGVLLNRVHYGSMDGTPAGNMAPGTGDPGFRSTTDARLRADSILIDSGNGMPQGGTGTFDADGRPRVQGVSVDVGAFESDLIFESGFQLDAW